MIRIGTSGFSYDDWKGPFYPETLRPEAFLAFYARHFGVVELNFTYYKLPSADGLKTMADRSQGRVIFCLKAHASMTHERNASAEDYASFTKAVAPLSERHLLGALLLQFPQSFHRTVENRKYLAEALSRLEPFPRVVEFRNAEWANPETLSGLEERKVGFCCVDEPDLQELLPRLHEVTGTVGYVRFHGRNAAQWHKHDKAFERYDYRYSEAELREWAPRLRDMASKARDVFVFFNNHYKGKAVDSAKLLETILAGYGAV